MSDLLPLVAAVLNDKASIDAYEEVLGMKQQLAVSRAIEIIRAANETGEDEEDVVVYASAQFEDGNYARNTNLWQVDFDPGSVSCRLADLRSCRVCVGGGFALESLNDAQANHEGVEVVFNTDEDNDGENSKSISLCFAPNSTWLHVVVHGWPSGAVDPPEALESLEYLVDDVADEFPDATVEFKSASFVVRHIHGALKRLLPPKRKEAVDADRAERLAGQVHTDLRNYVSSVMQDEYDAGSQLFNNHVDSVVGVLEQSMGIRETNSTNIRTIDTIITMYGEGRIDEFVELVQGLGGERVESDEE